MKTKYNTGSSGIAAVLASLFLCVPQVDAAVTFSDITFWAGVEAGPGVRQAALVIDWRDGQPPLVWGYRWGSERRTGQDMLAAVLGAERALSVDSLVFPNSFSYGGRTRSFSDNGTPSNYLDDLYWGYSVNNAVYNHPDNFLLNSHIVPPADRVVPLGNPYGETTWTESNTGAAGRELADGSWDGWAYGPYGAVAAEPVAAPEPAGLLPLLGFAALLLRRRRSAIAVLSWTFTAPVFASGPWPGGPGTAGSTAIPASSMQFRSWATAVTSFTAGPQQKGGTATPANYGSDASVLGPANATGEDDDYLDLPDGAAPVVRSLGDGGRITLRFAPGIADGAGADFAVFENGFGTDTLFAELAFVEISSDGVNFTRFPAVSCTQTSSQVAGFVTLNPRDLHNLAGKYPVSYGTPFDLSELAGTPGLNLQRITHVRIIDVVGSVNPALGSTDASGRLINDPFPTNFATGGFDLDAVGVIHEAAADPWLVWRAASFSATELADSGVSGAEADPDRDGRPNLTEYALGSGPRQRDAVPLEMRLQNGSPELVVPVPAVTDVSLRIQHSAVLGSWENLAVSTSGQAFTGAAVPAPVISAAAGMVTVRPRLEGVRFFRLLVTRP